MIVRLTMKKLAAFFALTALIVVMTTVSYADDQDMNDNEPVAEHAFETDHITLMGVEDNEQGYENDGNTEADSESQFEYDINVNVGQTKKLETGYIPEDPEDVLAWKSDNSDAAAVDEGGLLTGVAVGASTVTATSSLTGTVFVFHVTVYDSMKKCTVTLSSTKEKFAGSAIKPSVTVLTAGGLELDPSQYSVTYTNNNMIGEAKVTVTGKGYYTDSVSKFFIIIPGNSSIAKLIPTNKSITVNIEAVAGEVRYQLQYKNSSSKSWKSVKSDTKLSRTVNGLANNKMYNFRVRAYKNVNGKTYYGDWSGTKTVLAGIPISKCKIKGIKNKIYNGKKQSQTIKVYYKGKQIKAKITYGNRKNIGRQYVVIHGTGKFAGKVKKTYLIKPGKVEITGMYPNAWYDYENEYSGDESPDYEYYNENDIDNDSGYYIMAIDLKCSKAPGGVSYEFAFKKKGGVWEYARYGKSRSVYFYDYPKDKLVFAKVRAYRYVNGEKICGAWSSTQTETTHYKKVRLSDYYETKHKYISGKILGGYKGEIIILKIGKKTYAKTITKNGTTSFKFRVGRIKAGTDYKVYLQTKYKETLYTYGDEAWYAKSVKKGMTKHQVRYTWGKPDSSSSASGGWVFWYYDDGSYVYFKNGKVKYWYDK